MKCYLYECHHEAAGTWGMLLPRNAKPEWPGVTVRRIVSTVDEVDGICCLESQRVMLGPPRGVLEPTRARQRLLRPRVARPLRA